MHGLLVDEVEAIVALFHEWGVDGSHRKLVHRSSYLSRVWVCSVHGASCSYSPGAAAAIAALVASRGGLRATYHVRRVQDSGRVKPAAVLPP